MKTEQNKFLSIAKKGINKTRGLARKVDWKIQCKTNAVTSELVHNPQETFPIINHIKDSSYEVQSTPRVYHIAMEGKAEYYHLAMDILSVNNAIITAASDLVCTKQGVIWDKAYVPAFTNVMPQDRNLVKYDGVHITYVAYKKSIQINGSCISLLGVHADFWSHFIMQFLPKIVFAAKAGILNEDITIIVPDYKDEQVKEVVYNYLKPYKVNLVVAQEKTNYLCEKLYYIPSAVYYPNHALYLVPQNIVFPRVTLDAIEEGLVAPWIARLQNEMPKYDKIYLPRRGGTYRELHNWMEVEEYFVGKGFQIVHSHRLSLIEKVNLFFNAKEIAGPFSSAFYNVIWCNKETKLLTFSNLQRVNETALTNLASISGAEVMFVTGEDDEKIGCQTSYRIPLSRIESAYEEFMNNGRKRY